MSMIDSGSSHWAVRLVSQHIFTQLALLAICMSLNSSQEKDKLLVQGEDNTYSSFQNSNAKEEMSDDEIDGSDILSIQKGEKPLRYHFYEQVNKMISTSFGLIAALAWNEAIKALFVQLFGAESSGTTVSLFIYAVVITIFVIFVVFYIGRLAQMVEKFDRKTSAYMEQQKMKIKQQLKISQANSAPAAAQKEK